MKCEHFVFSGHAVRRMFERFVDEDDLSEGITGRVMATAEDAVRRGAEVEIIRFAASSALSASST